MLNHIDVWNALEKLASAHGLSCSGLALRCGLDSTTFNKSKRFMPSGQPRWISTATVAKVLNTLGVSIREFAEFFPDN